MTFLAPGFFFASLAVAAGVVALHFIVTRQPRAGILPTARFIPDMPATATARATRPSDLLLMLLRVLIVLAVGAGLGKPVFRPSHGAEARVILADASRSMRDSTAIRDSVKALYRDHDILVLFDSSARIVSSSARDSIQVLRPANARGNLSAAFIAAMRAGSALRDRADSIELVVVSPFAVEQFDAVTDSVRHLWKGKARLVSLARSSDTTVAGSRLDVKATASDPMQMTVAAARNDARATGVIVRTGTADSSAQGRAIIEWPITERPRGAIPRAVRDTIGGVISGNALVVSAFERRWSYPADSLRNAEVIARWVDGEPAAIETQTTDGCVRSVAIPVSPVGDLVIRPDFVGLAATLSRDCIRQTSAIPAGLDRIAALAGSGGLAARESFKPRADVRSDLAPWLIALAIVASIAELFMRRRHASVVSMARRSGEARAA
ncbi:MAG TPA: BatA domain-containing protein [Gemmatimonadaceae bacterium]|nr:BatA domain-containing protein [Gemmatimonadaceae bacterium]